MWTASPFSGSVKPDEGFRPGSDDDCPFLGLAGSVVSIVLSAWQQPLNANSELVFRHKTCKTVHFGQMYVDVVLACGRPLSENYLLIVGDPGDLWPKCKDSF